MFIQNDMENYDDGMVLVKYESKDINQFLRKYGHIFYEFRHKILTNQI